MMTLWSWHCSNMPVDDGHSQPCKVRQQFNIRKTFVDVFFCTNHLQHKNPTVYLTQTPAYLSLCCLVLDPDLLCRVDCRGSRCRDGGHSRREKHPWRRWQIPHWRGKKRRSLQQKIMTKQFNFQSVSIQVKNFNYLITVLHLPTKRDFVGY